MGGWQMARVEAKQRPPPRALPRVSLVTCLKLDGLFGPWIKVAVGRQQVLFMSSLRCGLLWKLPRTRSQVMMTLGKPQSTSSADGMMLDEGFPRMWTVQI